MSCDNYTMLMCFVTIISYPFRNCFNSYVESTFGFEMDEHLLSVNEKNI